MNEETVLPTEVPDSVPTEPAAVETEGVDSETSDPTATETEPEELPGSVEGTVFESLPAETLEYVVDLEPTETTEIVETTEVVVQVDYTPAFAEATSIIANIILCGCLMIVGTLCGIRFWR